MTTEDPVEPKPSPAPQSSSINPAQFLRQLSAVKQPPKPTSSGSLSSLSTPSVLKQPGSSGRPLSSGVSTSKSHPCTPVSQSTSAKLQTPLQPHKDSEAHSMSTGKEQTPSPTERTKSNSKCQEEIKRILNALETAGMEICASIYLKLQTDLRNNPSDDSPLLQSLLPNIQVFSRFLIRDIRLCLKPGPLDSGSLQVVFAGLRCVGFFIFHSQIIKALGETVCSNLLSLLCQVILQANEKQVCSLAVWCLTTHRFPQTVISQNASLVSQSLSFSLDKPFDSAYIRSEALNAFNTFLKKDSLSILKNSQEFLIKILWCAVDEDASIRDKASHILNHVNSNMDSLESINEQIIMEFFREHGEKYSQTLRNLELPDKRLIKFWAQLVNILGKSLIHSKMLSDLNRLLENCFNSKNPDSRQMAFSAWERLILQFAKDGFTQNRLSLLMNPILSTLRTESVRKVRLSAMKTWIKILHHCQSRIKEFFDQVIKNTIEALSNEKEVEIMIHATRIINSLVMTPNKNSPPKPVKKETSNKAVPELKFAVDDKWVREQTDFILAFINCFNRNNPKIYLQTSPIWKNLIQIISQINVSEIQHSKETIYSVKSCLTFLMELLNDAKDEQLPLEPTSEPSISNKILTEFCTIAKTNIKDRIQKSDLYALGVFSNPAEQLAAIYNDAIIFGAPETAKYLENADIHEFVEYLNIRMITDRRILYAWEMIAKKVLSLLEERIDERLVKDSEFLLCYPIRCYNEGFETAGKYTEPIKLWRSLFERLIGKRKHCRHEIRHTLHTLTEAESTLSVTPSNSFAMDVIANLCKEEIPSINRQEKKELRFICSHAVSSIHRKMTFEESYALSYFELWNIKWSMQHDDLGENDVREGLIDSLVLFLDYCTICSQKNDVIIEMLEKAYRKWKEILNDLTGDDSEISSHFIYYSGLKCKDNNVMKWTFEACQSAITNNVHSPDRTLLKQIDEAKLRLVKIDGTKSEETGEIEIASLDSDSEENSPETEKIAVLQSEINQNNNMVLDEVEPQELHQTPERDSIKKRQPLKDRTHQLITSNKRKADSSAEFKSPPSILKKRSALDTLNSSTPKNRRVSFQLQDSEESHNGKENVFLPLEEETDGTPEKQTANLYETTPYKPSDAYLATATSAPSDFIPSNMTIDRLKTIEELKQLGSTVLNMSTDDLFRLQGQVQTLLAQVSTEIQKRYQK